MGQAPVCRTESCCTVGWNSYEVAGWDPGGSFGRSLGHSRIRKLAVEGTAVGCHNLRHIVAVGVAVGSYLLLDPDGCNQSRIVVLGDHVGIVGRPVRWCRGKTVLVHGLDRCRRRAVNNLAEATAGNLAGVTADSLAEATDHTPVGQEKDTGHVEEAAAHTEVVAGHTRVAVPDSSLG